MKKTPQPQSQDKSRQEKVERIRNSYQPRVNPDLTSSETNVNPKTIPTKKENS